MNYQNIPGFWNFLGLALVGIAPQKFRIFWTFFSFFFSSTIYASQGKPAGSLSMPAEKVIQIDDLIVQSLRHHPEIKAALYDELVYEAKVTESQSEFYPHLSAQLKADNGLPGSSAATGVVGVIASPFHRGPGVGVFVRQNIWDFGRTLHAIEIAEGKVGLAQIETKTKKISIVQNALASYFSCARERALVDIYRDILAEAKIIEREVNHFVSTGQRSIVEQILARSQSAELITLQEDSQIRYDLELRRLAILTGMDTTTALCPLMGDELIQELTESGLHENAGEGHTEESPYLQHAGAKLKISLLEKKLAFDDFFPLITGIGSYGTIQETWANVPGRHWSVSVGFVLPFFEGFRTSANLQAHHAKILASENHLAARTLQLKEAAAHYDKNIESATLRIKNLKTEVSLADHTMLTAKKRYASFQGNLVDIRETFRNLIRSHHSLKVAEQEFVTNFYEKSILFGGIEKYATPTVPR